ncbi:putative cyclic nucleotide-binding domain, Ion transport domain, rmlC-like jelly roll [Helianthus annuus]|nr:putative cyclic nucleotide-binding domain, Ion transport domain, rmlC-like jelly roll [Helianthus annuus]
MRTILKFDKEDKVGKKLFHPEDRFIMQWNKTFLLCSVVALSLDPVFLYIPIINGKKKCLDMDRTLAIVVCVLRSIADILYVFHIIIMFRTMCLTPSNFEFGRGEYIDKPRYVAKHYLKSYFIMDILAALPLPQFIVFVIINSLDGPSSVSKENLLKFIIFSQYFLRVIQTSLFYQKVTKTSGFVIEKAWAGAAFNFFLYVLASHVVGALWYLFAIESEMRCWRSACKRHKCNSNYLYCGKDHVKNYGFLKTSCPLLERNDIKDSTNFDFGIFLDALQIRILETRDFRQKILYCSLWGLQSLSSLGQGLKASTFYGEILFADFVAVIGLVLFALLIGNMQKYLQSLSNLTHRMEEMKEKWREAEDLMSHMSLPDSLRQRVRRDKQYKWKITLGVELDTFFRDLPQDLRRDIKRHLCLTLLKRVPVFKQMDDILLDAVCDRLKQVLYTQNSFIVRRGEPASEMLFITRGEVEVERYITDEGTFAYFNARNLKAGDYFGEELLTWVSDPRSQLPFYTRTVQALTDVQAFALVADDLLFVASQFSSFHSRRVQYAFRFCSQQWRTWAACYIQTAWRTHCKRKREKMYNA